MCLCIAQGTNLSSLWNRGVWDFGGTCEYRGKGHRDILKKFYQNTRQSLPSFKGTKIQLLLERNNTLMIAFLKSSIRENSHPPRSNQHVLPGKDMIIDIRAHELRLQLYSASKGVTLSSGWADVELLCRDVQHSAALSSPSEAITRLAREPVSRNAQCQRGGDRQTLDRD